MIMLLHLNIKQVLFGAVTLTKNADFDKHGYSGCGIGLDRRGNFHFLVVDMVKMY